MIPSDLDLWFINEILIHEQPLTRYLQRAWPNAADVPDLRQDVLERVYQSARTARPLNPRAFLFAAARNLLADRARRSRVVSIDFTQDLESLNVLVDEISPEHRLSARQELRRLSEAFDRLPEDCRSAIWLRRVEGLSQREAAWRLGMPENTLASHLCRGIRALAKAVFAQGDGEIRSDEHAASNEAEHG